MPSTVSVVQVLRTMLMRGPIIMLMKSYVNKQVYLSSPCLGPEIEKLHAIGQQQTLMPAETMTNHGETTHVRHQRQDNPRH